MKNDVKRILISGGTARSIVNFRAEFIRECILNGFEVHILAPDLSKESRYYEVIKDLGCVPHEMNYSRTSTSLWSLTITFFKTFTVFKKVKPNIFFGYTLKASTIGFMAAIICNVKNKVILMNGLGYVFRSADCPHYIRILIIYFYK